MESGTCDNSEFLLGLEDAMKYGMTYSEAIGCANGDDYLECMQSKPAYNITSQVMRAYMRRDVELPIFTPIGGVGPVIDGTKVGVPRRPLYALQKGKINNVPLIIGSNQNEGSIFLPESPLITGNTSFPIQSSDLPKLLHHFLDRRIGKPQASTAIEHLLKHIYTEEKFKSPNGIADAFFGDYMFYCPSQRAARALSNRHNSKVYMYYFDYLNSWDIVKRFGNYHGFELRFLWKKHQTVYEENDMKVVKAFQTYWGNMAKYASPNGGKCADKNCTKWPLFKEEEKVLQINGSLRVIDDPKKKTCNYWDEVLGYSDGWGIEGEDVTTAIL